MSSPQSTTPVQSSASALALAPNEPSLCIPKTFENITGEQVTRVLTKLEFGSIDRVDMITGEDAKTGKAYKTFFIHFKSWHTGWETERRALLMPKPTPLKVVFAEPWFWMIWANVSKYRNDPLPVPVAYLVDPETQVRAACASHSPTSDSVLVLPEQYTNPIAVAPHNNAFPHALQALQALASAMVAEHEAKQV